MTEDITEGDNNRRLRIAHEAAEIIGEVAKKALNDPTLQGITIKGYPAVFALGGFLQAFASELIDDRRYSPHNSSRASAIKKEMLHDSKRLGLSKEMTRFLQKAMTRIYEILECAKANS